MGRLVARLAGALMALGTLAMPALAGDRASFNPIGFSQDARYFAFEEFGVQDGSGFPYSTVYVVDLSTDSWVSGSPFRARSDDEAASLLDTRAEALDAARDALARYGVDTQPEYAAMKGDGVFGEGKDLTFGMPSYGLSDPVGYFTLSLTTFNATTTEPCVDYMGEESQGFALTIVGEGVDRELHRDGKLPASRGCPWDYRLFAVVTSAWSSDVNDAVAIVSVYPHGFEGPDRRFIAVPIGNGR